MTPADLEAAAEIAGWDATRAQDEFEGTGGRKGFRPFYADDPRRVRNIRTSADVAERWRKWCTDGLRMDQEAAQSTRGNGSRRGSRADQADVLQDALRARYAEYQRRAQYQEE